MTDEELIERNKALHSAFDVLLAMFLAKHPDKTLTNTNLLELLDWSYRQTQPK